ncbi:DUF6622 family protein [Brenneria populi subsp. brevivirga]|uniref:DUF6622 family protein n=1 Tax=Brenneria populi TaxID=1505588 RepID=UPI002E16C06A|nr:DUF6622 family protein [Brenneria populi subsp. brevivirga]
MNIMENYLITVRHTPSWAWILLAYLIYAGRKALQPRRQSLRRLLVLPIVFLCWGASSILHTLALREIVVAGFLLALIVGLCLGWMLGKTRAFTGPIFGTSSVPARRCRWC